ncbi:HlyD family type I secretion periplasmic adaptor subunit [Pontibacterium sp.]|uniref:HlyD family type I secretion periplasmic adaptor subunit n=1 Tax=Pontibacterium sp. TaxID=2036026 RepID=UPI00356AFD35
MKENNTVFAEERTATLPRARARFLAQAIQLEEPTPSFIVPVSIVVGILLLIAVVVWSAFTEVNEVALAKGEVVPAGSILEVQHLEGGIVSELHVRNGDNLKEGQLILSLDPATSESELQQMQSRRVNLQLQEERLKALIDRRPPTFPRVGAGYRDLLERQRTIYLAQVNSQTSEMAVIESQIQQRRDELRRQRNQVASLKKELAIHREQVSIREASVVRGSVSKSELLAAKAKVAEVENELLQTQDGIAVARTALKENQQRKRDGIARFNRDIELEAGQVTSELGEVESTLIRLQARDERQEVRAPVGGIVQGLSIAGSRGVIAPGQVIMQIVPVDEDLIVEAKILPQDIGHVHTGQSAKLKFVSYDFSRFGSLDGTVNQISASTYLDEENQPYYRAEIKMDKAYLGAQPGELNVLPGMTLTADIQTGKKTILEYLLRPVTRGFDNAFRER